MRQKRRLTVPAAAFTLAALTAPALAATADALREQPDATVRYDGGALLLGSLVSSRLEPLHRCLEGDPATDSAGTTPD